MKKVIALLMSLSMLTSFGSVSATAGNFLWILDESQNERYIEFLKNQDACMKYLQSFVEEWNASDHNSTLMLQRGTPEIDWITINVLCEPENVDEEVEKMYCSLHLHDNGIYDNAVHYRGWTPYTDEVVPDAEKITDRETIKAILSPFLDTLWKEKNCSVGLCNESTNAAFGLPDYMIPICTTAISMDPVTGEFKDVVNAVNAYAAEQGIDTNVLTYIYTPLIPCEGTPVPVEPLFIDCSADVDENGVIDITDASLILQRYADDAIAPASDSDGSIAFLTKGDVNGDGKVDINDATLVLTAYADTAADLT